MASSSPSSVPDKMFAVQISKIGGPEVLDFNESAPVPALGENQVLVKNAFSGVNYIDTYFRTGLYPTPAENFPLTLGREAAGVVAALHPSAESTSPFKVGDPVVYMAAAGSYATYSAVPVASVLPLPQGLAPKTAAASLLQGLTAWTFVNEAGEVKPGEWVLVHAAAGGTGGLLVQMLKAVGARVIAAAGSDEKCEAAKAKGAEWTINSREKDVVQEVRRITEGKGADVVFDGVGKATIEADLQLAARKGRLVMFGNAVSSSRTPMLFSLPHPYSLSHLRPHVSSHSCLCFVALRSQRASTDSPVRMISPAPCRPWTYSAWAPRT